MRQLCPTSVYLKNKTPNPISPKMLMQIFVKPLKFMLQVCTSVKC